MEENGLYCGHNHDTILLEMIILFHKPTKEPDKGDEKNMASAFNYQQGVGEPKYEYYYTDIAFPMRQEYPQDIFLSMKPLPQPIPLSDGRIGFGVITFSDKLYDEELETYGLKSKSDEAAKKVVKNTPEKKTEPTKVVKPEQPKVVSKETTKEPVPAPESVKITPEPIAATPQKEAKAKPLTKKEILAQRKLVEPMIFLTGVPAGNVHSTKNPNVCTLSLPNKDSKSGYANILIKSFLASKQDDGKYTVQLGLKEDSLKMSLRTNGIHESRGTFADKMYPMKALRDMLPYGTTFVEKAPTGPVSAELDKTKENKSSKTPYKNVYVNGIPNNWIYDTQNPKFKTVCLPFSEADKGMCRIRVDAERITQTMNMSTRQMVPGQSNVNLGDVSLKVPVSFQRDGQYERDFVSPENLAEQLANLRKRNLERRKQALEEQVEQHVEEDECSFY